MFCRLADCNDDLLDIAISDIDAGNQRVESQLRINSIDSAAVLQSTTALPIARNCAKYYALFVCASRTIDLETPLSSKIEYYRRLYEDTLKMLTTAGLGLNTEIRDASFMTIDTERA